MSRLADEVPRVRNAHMRANVRTDPASGKKALTFLYEVADGPTDQSYGVEVAEMVKFPEAVLRTAKRKAEELGVISGRIQGAKSPEEFAQLARAENQALQTIACA